MQLSGLQQVLKKKISVIVRIVESGVWLNYSILSRGV